jgi:hypothetical protein
MTEFLRRLAATEPARLAEAVRVVLMALVTLGWVAIPDATVATIVTAFSALGSLLLTGYVRSRVYSPATVEQLTAPPEPPTWR